MSENDFFQNFSHKYKILSKHVFSQEFSIERMCQLCETQPKKARF